MLKEDLQTEFKSSFGDGVIESLCAFANTVGGRVLIGITDRGKPVRGFVLGNETLQKWVNEVKNKTQPSVIPDVSVIEMGGVEVAELSVKEFPVKPVAFKGRYLKRVSNANHQMTLSEIADMHLRSFNMSWDNYIDPGRGIDALSIDKVMRFISNYNEGKWHVIADEPLTVLNKYELVRDARVTNAAFLLFGREEVFHATIELGRFSSPTSIKDGLSVRSDLFSEVEMVLDFIRKHINKGYIITGDPRREEQWQYPMEAIREIVINMIVHRDYTDSGDSSVKLFDTHIEFFNPGKLPDFISIENLLSGNYSSWTRNKKIAAIFKEAQFIEKYGSGIRRIKEGFDRYGLLPPVFENFQAGFRVKVYGQTEKETVVETVGETVVETVGEMQTGRSALILNQIRNNPRITRGELAVLTNLTVRGVEYQLSKLRQGGLIERGGSTKSGFWRVKRVLRE